MEGIYMRSKKISGLIIVILGLVCLYFSHYIKEQVEQGKMQISEAQGKVDTANSIFSVNPVSKEVGKGLTSGAQRQINEGRMEVAKYGQLAMWLQIGGYVLIIVGVLVFLTGFRKKRHTH
jgi:putative Mn2+ efflux pump MntP